LPWAGHPYWPDDNNLAGDLGDGLNALEEVS
jgi:hypothetical protein